MTLPFCYITDYDATQKEVRLGEEDSRHVVQVLRMKKGERLNLTDGKGMLITAEITTDHKKHCTVQVVETGNLRPTTRKISIAISLLKNASRFEWFLEKATEIGINEIIPLACARTETQKFREDRMKNILVSAMLQSQQCWLPVLHKPIDFELIFRQEEIIHASQKFIAHCMEDQKRNLADLVNESLPSQIILVGPEGDFTPEEVQLAIHNHFDAVSLGETRLRAETAGVVAATILKMV
ncbi:MAG TPA: RsmE family RNA methyltransferase [Chitinophagaceae bacterium]|nr:RsmE family RNA methyltransferase [Chitinophagaceae bacterium]